MDEEETKSCQNCKREIPASNYTVHSLHCVRNIKVCPVCKEPVPLSELPEHHEKLHKLLPCKECGESICGTDLEDHVRDSCARTMKSCRFCELELRRGELPAHERYCGARTEQCAECGEWVMQRYRQLHLDSNHGFLRLDDDPEPVKRTNMPKSVITNASNGVRVPEKNEARPTTSARKTSAASANLSATSANLPATSANLPATSKNINLNCMQREFNQANPQRKPSPNQNVWTPVATTSDAGREARRVDNVSSSSNGAVPRSKRTNDQPQVNKVAEAPDKVLKNLWSSRGAVKKRPAPAPPGRAPSGPAGHAPPDPRRDVAAERALLRRQLEESERAEQTARNLAQGLPPVLSPAAKLEKLRKMDALHNREIDDQDYKNRLQGRVWQSPELVSPGYVLGRGSNGDRELERQRDCLRNLVPMTPEEFGQRFRELQLRKPPKEETGDRFSQIKSSLRELRRGLNEVTAPYNTNSGNEVNYSDRERNANVRAGADADVDTDADADVDADVDADADADADADDVALPCEFCDQLVPLHDLVRHQTGCRPDLAQLIPKPARARARPAPAAAPSLDPPFTSPAEPVIPCEFCMQSLPVCLITEHQVRCGREASLLYAD